MDGALKDRMFSITNVPFKENVGKYLGFPIHQGRDRRDDFAFIVDRVTATLASSWKANLLKIPPFNNFR